MPIVSLTESKITGERRIWHACGLREISLLTSAEMGKSAHSWVGVAGYLSLVVILHCTSWERKLRGSKYSLFFLLDHKCRWEAMLSSCLLPWVLIMIDSNLNSEPEQTLSLFKQSSEPEFSKFFLSEYIMRAPGGETKSRSSQSQILLWLLIN